MERITERRRSAQRDVNWQYCVAAIAAGQRQALHQLYLSAHGRVYCLALHITRSRACAQEIMQEVFLQVWSGATSYDARRGGVSCWLALLCRSRALDHLRAQARHQGVQDDIDEQACEAEPPEDGVQRTQRRSALRAALASLPPRCREMLILSYFHEHNYDEIARLLAMPLGSVKSRIRRARLALAKHPALAALG